MSRDNAIKWGKNKGKYPVVTYAELRTQAANYTAPKKIRRDQRRKEVLRLRQEENLTYEQIAERINAQADRFLDEGKVYRPEYVGRDIRAGLRVMVDDLEELAKEYLPGELADVDEEQQEVKEELKRVRRALLSVDPAESVDTYEKLNRVYDTLLNRLDKLRASRAKYLPLEAPKKVESKNTNLNLNLDDFLKAQKEFQQNSHSGEEEDIIEGEILSEDA